MRAEAAQSQERARRLALEPGTWSRDEAAGMAAEFDAMTAAAGRAWDATTSEACWGSWAVLRAR